MRVGTLKIYFSLQIVFLFALILQNDSHACDKPVFNKNDGLLKKVSNAGFRIDWTPNKDTDYYTLSYVLRVPEGRIVSQREIVSDLPFYVLPRNEFHAAERLHLVVELTAHCNNKKSDSSFAQFALNYTEFKCAFDKGIPELTNRGVSWLPVSGAQSYLVCFFKQSEQPFCRETTDSHNKIPENVRLIAVTPVCNGMSGTPAFFAMSNADTKK